MARRAGKVIRRFACALDAIGEAGVAAVVGLEDGKLPALRVVELDVGLTGLAILCRLDALARLRGECIVQNGQRRPIGGQRARNGAARAARAPVGEASNLYFVSAGAVAIIPLCDDGNSHGEAGEEGNDV